MRLVVSEQLVVHTGGPPIDALEFKKSVLNSFLISGKPEDVGRKRVCSRACSAGIGAMSTMCGPSARGRWQVACVLWKSYVRVRGSRPSPRAFRILARSGRAGIGEALGGIVLAEWAPGLWVRGGGSVSRMQGMHGAAGGHGEPSRADATLGADEVAEDWVSGDENWAELVGGASATGGGKAQGSGDSRLVWNE